MNRALVMLLNLVLLAIGALTVYSFPLNPLAIAAGMFLLAISILSIALQVYFPPRPRHVVLRVVEPTEPVKKPIKKRIVKKRVTKKAKRAKTKAKGSRKGRDTKRTRKTKKRR